MTQVIDIFKQAIELEASDLFIVAGKEIMVRVEGVLKVLNDRLLNSGDSFNLTKEIYELANREFACDKGPFDDDFALSISGLGRFRVNAYKQRGSFSVIIRIVKFGIPNYQELNIPENVMSIADLTRGLVLVTGASCSGKTTTLACIVDKINNTYGKHIITVEDPIEYIHRNQKSIVSQRELDMDTKSYLDALRASLRESPDVILLGEMRDLETISTALTASETGHLVISTLHTVGASNSIDRIIDVFPPEQQEQVRVQLSKVLKVVTSQQMLSTKSGDLMPAFEVLKVTNAIRSIIRENKLHQLDSIIASSSKDGMISMDDSIYQLYRCGLISKDTARNYALFPDQMLRRL